MGQQSVPAAGGDVIRLDGVTKTYQAGPPPAPGPPPRCAPSEEPAVHQAPNPPPGAIAWHP